MITEMIACRPVMLRLEQRMRNHAELSAKIEQCPCNSIPENKNITIKRNVKMHVRPLLTLTSAQTTMLTVMPLVDTIQLIHVSKHV